MCGGIIANLNKIPRSELSKYYSQEEIAKIKASGRFQSFFWDKQPILPIEDSGEVKLVDWGNRDKQVSLPQTGWAKQESVESGKWNHLKPTNIKIVADQGYEKGALFDFQDGARGILVRNKNHTKAYMITQSADEAYKKSTGHDRMPIGVKSGYRKIDIHHI